MKTQPLLGGVGLIQQMQHLLRVRGGSQAQAPLLAASLTALAASFSSTAGSSSVRMDFSNKSVICRFLLRQNGFIVVQRPESCAQLDGDIDLRRLPQLAQGGVSSVKL